MVDHFSSVNSMYHWQSRYSRRALRSFIYDLCKSIGDVDVPKIVDIGGGCGVLCKEYLHAKPKVDFYIADISFRMLCEAAHGIGNRASFVSAAAERMPFRSSLFDAAISCCAIQCFADFDAYMSEAVRITKPGGVIAIAMHDRDNLGLQLVHKYFPGFNDLDAPRHKSISDVTSAFQANGVNVTLTRSQMFTSTYRTPNAIIKLAKEKQFSAFSIMENDDFERGLIIFSDKINSIFESSIRLVDCGTLDWVIGRVAS